MNNHAAGGQNNVNTFGSSHKADGSISGDGRKDFFQQYIFMMMIYLVRYQRQMWIGIRIRRGRM